MKAFVRNTMNFKVHFEDVCIADIQAHPNMVVLPHKDTDYTFNDTERGITHTGFVDSVEVSQTIESDGIGGSILAQTVDIHCYHYQPESDHVS